MITGARCASALAPFVTHVLHPSWYQRRRSIRSRGQFMVTFPNSPIAHRDCLHGARCDEPPCRWLPRGTGDARASHTRGGDAAAACTAARDGVASLVQRCSAPAWQHGALRFSPPSHPSFRPFPFFLLFCFVFFCGLCFCHRDFSFLFFRLACLVTWSFVVFVLLWGSLSMGTTLTVVPSGSRTCQFHGRIPRNVCRGQRIGGGMHYGPSVIV